MSRNARLRVRIVLVPAEHGVTDARRRVAELLLRAANAGAEHSDVAVLTTPANVPPPPPGEKAA